ncbi:MAG TPA: hypothetical protein VM870_03675, partial [Pyrinomonadaceae bacterium]|nr:hypothetical protein [Pyrinomonadaceae bacterium]
LALAWKTGRTIYYFALGAAMGLCLYTFMASLLIWPVVAILLLIDFFRRPSRGHVVIAALMIAAFLLAVAPGILHSSFAHVVEVALHNSRREIAAADLGLVARTSIVQSFLVFWVNNQWRGIHVGSQLLDPLTGTLGLVGLPIALAGIRRRAEQLIVVWFFVVLLLQAGTNYVPGPSFTRMYILIPPVVLLAALTLTKLMALLRPILAKLPAPYVPALVLAPLLVVVPILNVYQLLVVNPADIVHNPFVMLMKTLQEHPASKIVEVGSEPQVDQNLLLMLNWYPALKNNYRYVNVNQLGADQHAAPTIYFISDQNEKLLEAVSSKLPSDYRRVLDRGPFGKDKAWLMMRAG